MLLLAALVLAACPTGGSAKEMRRSAPFIRQLLMGGAGVALGDDSSSLLYNPAGLARVRESSVEAFTMHFAADEQLTKALGGDETVQNQFQGLSPAEFANEVGTTLFSQVSLRMPVVVTPGSNQAWGLLVDTLVDLEVFTQSGLPVLSVEAFLDYQVINSRFWSIGDFLFLGVNFKLINRVGISKVIDTATLFAVGPILDLANDQDFQKFKDGKSRTRIGMDLGLIFQAPGNTNWQPRFGIAFLNVGDYDKDEAWLGIEFGERPTPTAPPGGGELPLNAAIGFAVSPSIGPVRITVAADLVDLGERAIPGDSRTVRSRIGVEIGIGPHKDGTALFSFLFGWNATHFGGGFLSRISIFEIGMGRYTVERGAEPDDQPEDRRVAVIGFRF